MIVSSLFVCLFVCFCLFVLVMNISFTRTVINVREGVGVVEFVLRKTPGAVGPVSVLLRTHEGTARGEWINYQYSGTYVQTPLSTSSDKYTYIAGVSRLDTKDILNSVGEYIS